MSNIPRSEYPRPQFVRENWLNLNGQWEFEIDNANSGIERKLFNSEEKFNSEITVPFCPESKLSGIGNTDFMSTVWYRKTVTIPNGFNRGRVILHFGACDYQTIVWINGKKVGNHFGGYTSFSFDVTDALNDGENTITVCAHDDMRGGPIYQVEDFRFTPSTVASGKQCYALNSVGCHYTRTTGIWQTVWLESVPVSYIRDVKITTDIQNSLVTIEAKTEQAADMLFSCKASFDVEEFNASSKVIGDRAAAVLKIENAKLWDIGSPNLYDLEISLGEDKVKSYFGIREVAVKNGFLQINGRTVFQRLVLDQGFYPDGIYTAPSDQELINDIKRSMACGFNGARLHEKIFEPRFLYHADRLGYIVWGEHGNWGLDHNVASFASFIPEWIEAVKRDYNHPSIIGWCPLNETPGNQNPEFVKTIYNLTKALDSTRPAIDTSGFIHVGETDIYDVHDYDQNHLTVQERYKSLLKGENIVLHYFFGDDNCYPSFISEYGGVWWNPSIKPDENSWGYGERPKTEEEALQRILDLSKVLLENKKIGGFCYTQLTDVEQEQNGLYTYDRKAKFDCERIKAVLSMKAACEE